MAASYSSSFCEDGLALLSAPSFQKTMHDRGYVKGDPPVFRENGDEYMDAATWSATAFAALGEGREGGEALVAETHQRFANLCRRDRYKSSLCRCVQIY